MNEKRFFFLTLQLFYYILFTQGFPQGGNNRDDFDVFNAVCSIDMASNDRNSWKDIFWTLNKKQVASKFMTAENSVTISIQLNNSDVLEHNLECLYDNHSVGVLRVKGKLPKVFEPDIPIIFADDKKPVFWKDSKEKLSVNVTHSATTISLAYTVSLMNTSKEAEENVSSVGLSSQYIFFWSFKFSTFFFLPEFEPNQQMPLSYEFPGHWNANGLQCPNRTLQNLQKVQYLRYSQEIFINWTSSTCDKALINRTMIKICGAEKREETCREMICDENCWFKNLTSYKTYILKHYYFLQVGSVLTLVSIVMTKPCDPVSNITVIFKNATQISLSWNSPSVLGGEIGFYYITYRDKSQHVNEEKTMSVTSTSLSMMKGIEGYKIYIFTIYVLIKNATEFSDPAEIEVATDVGNPSDIQQSLQVYYESHPNNLTLHWRPPKIPNGPIDYYLLSYNWEENGKKNQIELKVFKTSMNLLIACNLRSDLLYKFQVRAININFTGSYNPSNEYVEVTLCQTDVWTLVWITVVITFTTLMLCFIVVLLFVYFQRCVMWLGPPVIMPEDITPSTVYAFSDKEDQISSCVKCCLFCWKKDKSLQSKSDAPVEVKSLRPRVFSNDSGFEDNELCSFISSTKHTDKKHYSSVSSDSNFNQKFAYNKVIIEDNSANHYSFLMPSQEVKSDHLISTSDSISDNIICNPFYILTSDDKYSNMDKEVIGDESNHISDSRVSKSLDKVSRETINMPNIEETLPLNYEHLSESNNSEIIHMQNKEKFPEYCQVDFQDVSHDEFATEDKYETLYSEQLPHHLQRQSSGDSLNIEDPNDTAVTESGYCVVALSNNSSDIVSSNLEIYKDEEA